MSIQRWDPGYELMLLQDEHSPGEWVTYADHVAEVEAMRAACIAAVEEFFRMPTDEQITEWVDTYGEAEWFEQACLAALRGVQP